MQDPSVQLKVSKPSIKDLLKDLLNEMEGFKYQITLKVLLIKCKENKDRELTTIYFNSVSKPVIHYKYNLHKSFQKVLNRIDNCISE